MGDTVFTTTLMMMVMMLPLTPGTFWLAAAVDWHADDHLAHIIRGCYRVCVFVFMCAGKLHADSCLLIDGFVCL